MAQHALFGHKAKLLLFCRDVSPRLISEFEKTIELHHFKVKVIKTDITIDEIYFGVGYKAGVITVLFFLVILRNISGLILTVFCLFLI